MGFTKNTLVIIDLDTSKTNRDKSQDRLAIVSTSTGRGLDKTNVREFNNISSVRRVANDRLTTVNIKNTQAYDEILGEHHVWLENRGFFKRYDG